MEKGWGQGALQRVVGLSDLTKQTPGLPPCLLCVLLERTCLEIAGYVKLLVYEPNAFRNLNYIQNHSTKDCLVMMRVKKAGTILIHVLAGGSCSFMMSPHLVSSLI